MKRNSIVNFAGQTGEMFLRVVFNIVSYYCPVSAPQTMNEETEIRADLKDLPGAKTK